MPVRPTASIVGGGTEKLDDRLAMAGRPARPGAAWSASASTRIRPAGGGVLLPLERVRPGRDEASAGHDVVGNGLRGDCEAGEVGAVEQRRLRSVDLLK